MGSVLTKGVLGLMKTTTFGKITFLVASFLCVLATLTSATASPQSVSSNTIRLAFASTAADTGIPKWLIDDFRKLHPDVEIVVSSVGAIEALDMARRGQADLVVTHHQPSEELFVRDGLGTTRNIFMYNEFAFFGPPKNNLGLQGETDIRVALRKIAKAEVPFYAPASRSGTALKLDELWAISGIRPTWIGYEISGSSARSTLSTAAQFGSYAFADIGTYLAMKTEIRGQLTPLIRDMIALHNYYAVLPVSAKKVPGAHQGLAETFRDYLLSERGQQRIGAFAVAEHSTNLFIPAAHLDDTLRAQRAEEKLRTKSRLLDITLVFFLAVSGVAVVAGIYWRRAAHSDTRRQLSEERFALAVDGTNDGIWDWDINNSRIYVSPRFREIMHIEGSGEWLPESKAIWLNILGAQDRDRLQQALDEVITGKGPDRFVFETKVGNEDKLAWVLIRGKAYGHIKGIPSRIAGAVTDVSIQRERDEYQHQSLHDVLTGLPNRILLRDRLDQMILMLVREEDVGIVMMLDLDGFKLINDINGHHTGDLLLIEVAKRMKDAVRLSDTVARLGGDEFVVLLPKTDIKTASGIATKITSLMEQPFVIDGKSHYVHTSIGISAYPQHATNAEQLLKKADEAMYSTKRTTRHVAVYSGISG